MLSIVIQAGGESSRMGQDKALVPFLGAPLIQRVFERLVDLGDEMLVTTNHPELFAFLRRGLPPIPCPAMGRWEACTRPSAPPASPWWRWLPAICLL